jgi:hypothetical protein
MRILLFGPSMISSHSPRRRIISVFRARFDIDYLVVKTSPEDLAYKLRFPENWKRLLAAGISESDLLVKSIAIVLRKANAEGAAA